MNNRWIKAHCVIVFLLISTKVSGQDERFTRKLLSGDLTRVVPIQSEKNYSFKARSPYYEIDLNNDFRSESFVLEKKDGEDWLHIFSYKKKKIYSYKLNAAGPKARLYRITSKRLSSRTNVFILHYFEGINNYLTLRGQARYYFLTIDNNDLKTLATYKGPAYWEEFKSFKQNHYHQRKYNLTAVDFNHDGVKELSLSYNNSNTVFFYAGKGSWITF